MTRMSPKPVMKVDNTYCLNNSYHGANVKPSQQLVTPTFHRNILQIGENFISKHNTIQLFWTTFKEQKFCDLTLQFDKDTNVQVHKIILLMSSSVFEDLVNTAEGDFLELEDNPDHFKWVIYHMYTGSCRFPYQVELLKDLYKLFKKYKMDAAATSCAETMTVLTTQNTLDIVYDPEILSEERSLRLRCQYVIESQGQDILVRAKDTGQFSGSILKEVLKQDIMNMPETDIFAGLLNWCKKQLDKSESNTSMREFVIPYLSHIRFLSMTREEIIKHVIPSNILTDEELNAILLHNNPNFENSVPSFICKLKRRRGRRIAKRFLKICHIMCSQKCLTHRIRAESSMCLINFQLSRCVLLSAIVCNCCCFSGKWTLTVDSDVQLIGENSNKVPFWRFDPPLELKSNETYSATMHPIGSSYMADHKTNMFYKTFDYIEITGDCFDCDISLHFFST